MIFTRGLFPYLWVRIDPSSEGGYVYKLSVQNTGNSVLRNVRIIYGPLLHPGNFGLDDAHMPEDIWVKAPVLIPQLEPGEIATFSVEGYNVPERYDGRVRATAAMDFSDLAESPRYGDFYYVEVDVNLPNAR